MSENPIAKCDQCGRPIYYGNRPDGTPNGVGMVKQDGSVVNFCAECICKIGMTGEIPECARKVCVMASEDTEKIPDIVDEIRYQARVFHDAGKTYAEYTLTDYADRIEAAASRACRAIDVQVCSTCIEGCEVDAIRETIEEHFGEVGSDE